jgi:hypothetical protein
MRIRFQPFAALGLVVSLLLSAASVAAQDQRDAWSRVSLLSGGTKLSVKLKTGKTINGEFRTASDTTLSLTAKNAPLEVRREEIATVHEVTKKSATKATLIGTGVGAGAGAAAGAITDSANDDGFEKLDTAATGVLTVAGAGVGALVGFLVGRSGNKRVLVYEAK